MNLSLPVNGMRMLPSLHPFSESDPSSVTARQDQRMAQWGFQETKEFIAMRAELEKVFIHTKRNKRLWEVIVTKMKEKGYRRNADQCKCKWKNLVHSYKMVMSTSEGKETSEPNNGRCPFYKELNVIFTERTKNMDKILLESGPMMKKRWRKGLPQQLCHDQDSGELREGEDDLDEISGGERRPKWKRITDRRETQRNMAAMSRANHMQDVLESFFEQLQHMEVQWRASMRRREEERKARAQEFQNAMQRLENERLVREQQCRDIEEQRRAREEARAEKRDILFSVILSRLAKEELKSML